ncbi:MAG: hypothetical protein IJV43_03175 [Oscillospiraceae bacterium]|nr:hypothetical protein [Oscillospiraceae bacterium]
MKNTKQLLVRAAFVAVLIAIGAVMMVIGRGHTVYFDNKTLEYNGASYAAPYKVVVYVKGEQIAKLYAKERGMTTHVGQSFGMALGVTQEKGGDEQIIEVSQKLPYGMDGVIINIPGYLAGLPEEAYISEFIAVPTAEELQEETPAEGDELMIDAEF